MSSNCQACPAQELGRQQRLRYSQRRHGNLCFASAAAAADAGGAAWAEGGSATAATPSSTPSHGFPTWIAAIRAALFYFTTFIFATPLFTIMLVVAPFVLLFDKHR